MSARVWSLWQIMDRFKAFQVAHLVQALTVNFISGTAIPGEVEEAKSERRIAALRKHKLLFEEMGLLRSSFKIGLSILFLEANTPSEAQFSTECRNIVEAIIGELSEHAFVKVDSGKIGYVNNDALFGDVVAQAFPSAQVDLRDAGNCLAVDCGTAAVFHLMRAVEWGLRGLCSHFRLTKIKRRSKKTGKDTYTPISYAEWETMLNQLHPKVDEKVERMRKGPAKQAAQEFYYPLLQDLKAFRDAWRNHVMHTRRIYSAKDADAILEHVKRFMTTLAGKVSERGSSK